MLTSVLDLLCWAGFLIVGGGVEISKCNKSSEKLLKLSSLLEPNLPCCDISFNDKLGDFSDW